MTTRAKAKYRTRLKVCCIGSVREAQLAVRYGAHAVGLVSSMPSGPGVISESLIAEIAATVPPGVATFLLTSCTDADRIIEQQRRCRANTLQLVDTVDPAVYPALRQALPGIGFVQVIHVTGEAALKEAQAIAPHVDALLLDSGNPDLPRKELGGTGRIHNWAISQKIVNAVTKPVWLAGGLNPNNIVEAIDQVRPFGIDICSGLRTNGLLDEGKLSAVATLLARQN